MLFSIQADGVTVGQLKARSIRSSPIEAVKFSMPKTKTKHLQGFLENPFGGIVEGEREMKKLIGGPGTLSGLILRIGQFLFAAATIGTMASSAYFSSFTAFSYLIASMGLQVLWSSGLACLDVYALRFKRHLHHPLLVSLFAVGDWVTATLSLAAACASAGVTELYVRDFELCKENPELGCNGYQVSVGLAFITWSLVAISSVVTFWMLGSV